MGNFENSLTIFIFGGENSSGGEQEIKHRGLWQNAVASTFYLTFSILPFNSFDQKKTFKKYAVFMLSEGQNAP